jgi:plasmid stabilization system protein ParE
VNPTAAARVVRQLVAGAKRIPAHPRLGVRLPEFDPREVRRVLVGDYELRYELTDTDVFVLSIFHTREDR